jgi:hypothetical protein
MANAFDNVHASSATDYLLRNTHQELVALSGQADFKASVMITASSIVASIAAVQVGDSDYGASAGVLIAFLILALLTSVVAVFPKFRSRGAPDAAEAASFNPLFFGHYAYVNKDEYLEHIGALAHEPGATYEAIAADLYDKGRYLITAKYRYLRLSYVCFLLAFVLAALTYAGVAIFD